LLFRVVTKTVRDLLRADKPFFMHFIYVQNRCSTLYFYFALNILYIGVKKQTKRVTSLIFVQEYQH
ncbi:hypothetical protein Q0N88_32525, partial [Bacillus thuringiensis]|uniref:hypothetical protein n=1 Tax=Bacillus thuringiensis TaxID=1428 RepID=UPI0034586472